jgi:uncharacterized protein (TIGR00369 family)
MSDADESGQRAGKMAELVRGFAASVPHNRALGLEMVSLEVGRVCMRLPYSDKLVGNPVTGVLHGGAITALLDACAGAAVFMALDKPMPIATLDLRIDYLKPALAERDVIADLECYKRTSAVAFVRGVAYHDDRDDPIAAAAGSFMLGTQRRRRSET